MSEVQTQNEDQEDPIVPPPPMAPRNGKAENKPKSGERGEFRMPTRATSLIDKIGWLKTKATVRDIAETFAPFGGYRVRIKRTAMGAGIDSTVKDDLGNEVSVVGHLKTIDDPDPTTFDEEWIKKKFGGGKYELTFTVRTDENRYEYFTNRTFEIAGPPILEHGAIASSKVAAAPPATRAGDDLAKQAMDMMRDTADRERTARERAEERAEERANRPISHAPSMDATVVDLLRDQLAASNRIIESLRDEIRAMANKPATVLEQPKDEYKDKILSAMLDGDSARMTSMRANFDSEIRQLKQSAQDLENRLRDQFQRERDQLMASHQREIDNLVRLHESSTRHTSLAGDMSLTAAKSSFDTQVKILEAENRRLERDNADLKVDNKELRARKEKSLIETARELEAVKDALGLDGGEDKTTFDKVMEAVTNPSALEAIGGFFNKKEAAPVQQQQQPEQQQQFVEGQIYEHPSGQKFMVRGGKFHPVKRMNKRKVVRQVAPPAAKKQVAVEGAEGDQVAEQAADGLAIEPETGVQEPEQPQEEEVEEVALPEISQEDMSKLIMFFESSFSNRQEPSVVAQGIRSRIPEDVMTYLNHQVSALGVAKGVDQFFTQVAQLPGSSSLASQAGKNWIRAVVRELVGE